MKKKLIGIFIVMLLSIPILSSTVISASNDDVEITISTGRFGLDVGRNLKVEVVNNKNENVTIHCFIYRDYYIRALPDREFRVKKDLPAGETTHMVFPQKFAVYHFSITVIVGDNMVREEGFGIFVFLKLLK